MVYICYALAGLNYLVVLLCAIWLFCNRERSQVRVSQPTFLLMILLGCVISTSSIFALAQQHHGNGPVQACMAIPWLYSTGFSITFGALFARIRRIYVLLQSAVEMKRVSISSTETILTVVFVLILDGSVLTVWTIVDPLHWIRTTTTADVFGEPLESTGLCWSEHWKVFGGIIASLHLLLMAIACYMCYLAKAIPERISNLKYVAIAMFGNFQILVVLIPILIILGSDPQTSFFVRSVGIWLNDVVVVTLVFGDLIYKIQKRRRKNDFRSSELVLNEDIRTYAQKTRIKKERSVLHRNLDAADEDAPPQVHNQATPLRSSTVNTRHSSQQMSLCSNSTSSGDGAKDVKALKDSAKPLSGGNGPEEILETA